jgi:hypothetical protein
MERQSFEINFQNLYEQVTYRYSNNIRENALYMYWDRSNDDINKLMKHEMSIHKIRDYKNTKYNSFWVGKLKECVDWNNGDLISFRLEILTLGMVKFVICDPRYVLDTLQINEDGYLCLPYYEIFDDFTNSIYIKCDCEYNDLMDGDNEPYVLKYNIICTFENLDKK